MRRANVRFEVVLGKCASDPVGDEGGVGVVVDMLQLTSAALGEVTAWRHLVMRTRDDGAIIAHEIARSGKGEVAPGCRHAVAARRDAHDGIVDQ